ncbi:MFS transporter [Aestuariibacter sp. AA17]|uniref:MFS transporter n=1 Tax=Fluctibacter corallii TaxID=2984329 RepID=A0ABT3AA38_9ALTE|nr:MFS transporter [Aestuariibacter sp. AA17]MCV2885514.1 MFS transporter [Aestuariibacter sp. AA17]
MHDYRSQLFRLSCVALTVTSMTFAIRAGILGQLGLEFGLTDTELGWINAMAFLGFPVATMFGGAIYNAIGARKLLVLAFLCHFLGLTLTVTADGFWGLLISTFLIGFANGSVEAGCNPLIAELYPQKKTTMLNRFHVWFPGGIVIGAIASNVMTSWGLSWQWQVSIILLPNLLYGAMMLKAYFPDTHGFEHSTISNLKHLISPVYLFLVLCMTFTATAELGTQQWIERILGASGASPMLILALMAGLMAIGRYFAGPIVKTLNPAGVLLASAVLSTAGIYMLSQVSGGAVYFAVILFALGVTYFWPTMLGCAAEYTPKTGAMGMSLLGGAGMFAVSMWNPIIGSWIDTARVNAQASNASDTQVGIDVAQAVLSNLLFFPAVLIVAFIGFYFYVAKCHASAAHAPSSISN